MPFSFRPWTCGVCGESYIPGNKPACPRCSSPRGANGALVKQIICVYKDGDVMKAFQQHAARLLAQGWRVQSQSAGGQSSNVGKALLFGPAGLAAGRKLKEMTVVYARD